MTRQKLYNLLYLAREIEVKEKQLRGLESLKYSISGSKITGMPKATGNRSSQSEELACKITDLEAELTDIKTERIREQIDVERWIRNIPDALTRLVFTLRFVEGKPWREVARAVNKKLSVSAVRMICYRYFEANNIA